MSITPPAGFDPPTVDQEAGDEHAELQRSTSKASREPVGNAQLTWTGVGPVAAATTERGAGGWTLTVTACDDREHPLTEVTE